MATFICIISLLGIIVSIFGLADTNIDRMSTFFFGLTTVAFCLLAALSLAMMNGVH